MLISKLILVAFACTAAVVPAVSAHPPAGGRRPAVPVLKPLVWDRPGVIINGSTGESTNWHATSHPIPSFSVAVSHVGSVFFSRLRYSGWGSARVTIRGQSRYYDRDIGYTEWTPALITLSEIYAPYCYKNRYYRWTVIHTSSPLASGRFYTSPNCAGQ